MCYGYHIWSQEALMQAETDDDLDGGQRSLEIKWGKLCAYGYHIWSKEALRQAENDCDLDGSQRSSEVKYGNICAMATIFGQKNCWCKLRMMMTFTGVKDHQRSNVVNYATKTWSEEQFRMTVTFMEVKGQQRSNTVNSICTTDMIFGE